METGEAPFDTVVIDEAGQVPLATSAMLSLLARERVLLAGDPRQLAPISRAARIFVPSVKRFIAESAINALALPAPGSEFEDPALLFLDTQHRSDAPIGDLISAYQYEGRLLTSPALATRPRATPELPAAFLIVLDDEPVAKRDPARARAERPPGRSGWQRPLSVTALGRLFDAYHRSRPHRGCSSRRSSRSANSSLSSSTSAVSAEGSSRPRSTRSRGTKPTS